MTTITFILVLVLLAGLIIIFRFASNFYDKFNTQNKVIIHEFEKITENLNKLNQSIRNNTGIINMLHDDIDALDERVEEHWIDYSADFSLIKDRLNSCKYKTRKSVKKLANTEKQDNSIKLGENFNYTKSDE